MSEARRRGLGRGLDALLGAEPDERETVSASGAPPQVLPIASLRPNPRQPRRDFDEDTLEELAQSIRQQGVIQPIVVVEEAGAYSIIAGERRWRAAQKAKLTEVPVVIRSVQNDRERLELALVENLQRTDLNPLDEAEAYESLCREFGLAQDQVAERVGKARSTVTNALRLLRLPGEVRDLLRAGRLTAGQARPLLGVSPEKRQIELARRAIAEGLSARALEKLAGNAQPKKKKDAPRGDVHTRAAQERLIQALQTRVEIRRRGPRGRVVIHFHSEEELIRIYERLIHEGS
jgi:ParB family transcriptional regulator, chromosome partitioning protein